MHYFRHIILIVSAMALCSLVAAAAEPFEGKIAFDVVDGRDSMKLSYLIKGKRQRVDVKAGAGEEIPGAILIDAEKERITVLIDEQRSYMTFDRKRMFELARKRAEEMGASGSEEHASNSDVAATRTGEKETILGYECEKVILRDGPSAIEMCVTSELGSFVSFMSAMNPMPDTEGQKWEHFLMGGGYFPLRIVQRDGRGRNHFSMMATEVSPGPVGEDSLSIPKGYQEFAMPGMP